MKYIILPIIFLISALHANIIDDTVENIHKEIKEFRTYPRIEKVKNYIAKKEYTHAKKLLEKVLSIDPKNMQAAKMITTICLELGDTGCIETYAPYLKEAAYTQYYLASSYYKHKAYKKAYRAASSIKDDSKLTAQEKKNKENILLKSALLSKQKKNFLKHLSFLRSVEQICTQSFTDLIILSLEHKQFNESKQLLNKHLQNCEKDADTTQNYLIWADILRKNKQIDMAFKLMNSVEDSPKKFEELVNIYLEKKSFIHAAETMEKLYKLTPSVKNKKRLLYLYTQANASTKITNFYEKGYQKKQDPYMLKALLFSSDDPKQQNLLLKKYYPFKGLDHTQKFNFSSQLIAAYAKKNDHKHIISILDDLTQLPDLNEKERQYIIHQYHKYGNTKKAVLLTEKLYRDYPSNTNKEKLGYLYDATHQNTKLEKLLLRTAQSNCDRKTILQLMNIRSKSNSVLNRLENYIPFLCLKEKERSNLLITLIHHYNKQHQINKISELAHKYQNSHLLSIKDLLFFAYFFQKNKHYKTSNIYARKILQKSPDHYKAYTILADNFYRLKYYKQAIKYFKKLYHSVPKNYALAKTLGELYYHQQSVTKAIDLWKQYLQHHKDPAIALQVATLLWDKNKHKQAKKYFMMAKPDHNHAADYYVMKAKIAEADKNETQAIKAYKHALTYDPKNISIRYKCAMLLEKNDQYSKAITCLENGIPYTKEKAKYYAQIGYWYQKYHNYINAKKALKKALHYKKDVNYYQALAQCEVKLDQREHAVTNFKKSLDLMQQKHIGTISEKYLLKKSIQYLDKTFSGYLAFVSGKEASANLSPLQTQNHIGGYAALKLSYTPKSYTDRFQIYLNTAIGVQSNSLRFTNNTLQPSIGVSYQVTKDTMVVVSVESLIKGGSKSRNDIMGRISASFFDDYSFNPQRLKYWYKNLYLDLAYFFESDSYRFFTKYEYGYIYKLNYQNALMPYLITTASMDNDNNTKEKKYNLDIGIGLAYFFWLDETDYKSHAYIGRFNLEARKAYKTNYTYRNQTQMSFELLF